MNFARLSLLLSALAVAAAPTPAAGAAGTHPVAVDILEGLPDNRQWDLAKTGLTETYSEPALALVALPTRYSPKGHALDRQAPFVLRATAKAQLPAGEYRLLLRSREAARLFVDGKLVAEHGFPKVAQDGHNPVPPEPEPVAPGLPRLHPGERDKLVKIRLDGREQTFRLEVVIGSRNTRPELGTTVVAVAGATGPFRLLADGGETPFQAPAWDQYVSSSRRRHADRDAETRRTVGAAEAEYWDRRHELARRHVGRQPAPAPPAVSPGTPVHNDIDRFLGAAFEKAGVAPNPLLGDLAFLRRVTLDTVGTTPSRQAMLQFLADKSPDRRARLIDRLLDDPAWADHWVSFWQDLLAENPSLIKPELNNTGPFRLWLHQALSDNLPLDRFATELVMMEGSPYQGAPAAFALATNNDVPPAAKAHILARAFLAADLGCARCHDAPFHPYEQKQLFGMAAMLNRAALKVPATSTVVHTPGGRRPRVNVALRAGAKVEPAWHFAALAPDDLPEGLLRDGDAADSRARLAAVLTSPANPRFARVLVNRVWQRHMGVGLVDNLDDWSEAKASHPELLDHLARELISHNYDLKHVVRLILNSHAYQRAAQDRAALADDRLFAGPARRRLTAEQLLDSLFVAVGKEFDCEELTFDPECWMAKKNCINLGRPRRAWQFVDLSNDRDRPALALPVAQGYVDLLAAFGWRAARPAPVSSRYDELTPVQVMALANGQLMHRLVRLTDDGEITELCLEDLELPELVRRVYERVLTRPPTAEEAAAAADLLGGGYDARRTGRPAAGRAPVRRGASWAVHLRPEATQLLLEAEQAARAGDPPTERLDADWRGRMEDFLWALLNSPEFVHVP